MTMLPSLALFLAAIILHSSELSSQSEYPSATGFIPGVARTANSDSPTRSPPPVRDRSRSPRMAHWSPGQSSSSEPPQPTRCLQPPDLLPSYHGPGNKPHQLPYIQLTTRTASERTFQFRRYSFPAAKKLKLLVGPNKYEYVPPNEQIVLSTFDGDVFAILETTKTLAGIYKFTTDAKGIRRVKINIASEKIIMLTTGEISDTPVGPYHPIRKYFIIKLLKGV